MLSPKIWNELPQNMKRETSLSKFREYRIMFWT